MAINLTEKVFAVRRAFTGSDSLEAGPNMVIKFRVGSTEILSEKVPAGKQWRLTTAVTIVRGIGCLEKQEEGFKCLMCGKVVSTPTYRGHSPRTER